jgi:hypothetical protein
MSKQAPDPDAPIFGAQNIARAANMFTKKGEPDTNKRGTGFLSTNVCFWHKADIA